MKIFAKAKRINSRGGQNGIKIERRKFYKLSIGGNNVILENLNGDIN